MRNRAGLASARNIAPATLVLLPVMAAVFLIPAWIILVGRKRTRIDTTTREINQKGARYKLAPAKTAATIDSLGSMSKSAKSFDPSSFEGKDMLKTSKAKARVMSKKPAP